MTDSGTKIFVAAGNSTRDLSRDCSVFPACYPIKKNFFVVGGNDSTGHRAWYSDFGGPVKFFQFGGYSINGKDWEGTSFATPRQLVEALK
jgi:hypothetical protein